MKMMARTLLCAALAAVLISAGAEAAKKPPLYGQAIDPKAPRVTLAQLLKNPDAYDGKTVVVEGTYGGACCESDFFFKDKFDLIEAYPPDKAMMKACKTGDRIRLYGTVKVHRREESAEQGKEKSKAEEATVVVLGKGVELVQVAKRTGAK